MELRTRPSPHAAAASPAHLTAWGSSRTGLRILRRIDSGAPVLASRSPRGPSSPTALAVPAGPQDLHPSPDDAVADTWRPALVLDYARSTAPHMPIFATSCRILPHPIILT